MAVVADRVVVELEARLNKYDANLRRAEQTFTRTTSQQQRQIRALESQIRQSSDRMGRDLRGLAGSFAAYFSAREIIQVADAFTRVQNQLRVAGYEGAELADVQERLFASAQRFGAEYESVVTLFGRASQVQGDLGASQEQMLALTEAVGAALKVQGTSAQEAQGALLQLGQALGSGVVRAEEFNSILEGALPLAQAAARGIDGFDGSVARLRASIADGEITSRQFFEGILAGAPQLLEQAESATLTLSGAFQQLQNAVVEYIGGAASASGISGGLADGISLLAENIGALAEALAILAVVMGVRFVGAAVLARGALTGTAAQMGAVGAASFALQARLIGATTTMGALSFAARGAGASLLAAFGGPVGVAVLGLAAGIYYLTTQTETAEQRLDRLAGSAEEAEQEADAMERRLREAGVTMYQVETASDAAAGGFSRAGAAARDAEGDLHSLEQQAIRTAVALVDARLQENIRRSVELGREQQRADRVARSPELAQRDSGIAIAGQQSARDAEREQLDREYRALNRQRNAIIEGVRAGVDVNSDAPTRPPRPTPTPSSTGSTRDADAAAREAAREARREAQARAALATELEQLNADELQARAELTGTIEDRLAAELARIEADAHAYTRQVQLDEDLTAAQREELVAERAQVDAIRIQTLRRNAQIEEMERNARLESEISQSQQDLIRAQLDMAESRQERAALEHRLLDLQQEQERAELRQLIASLELADADERELEIARERLRLLEQRQEVERQGVDRRNESPLERYSRGLDRNPDELSDDVEQLVVDEIEHLRRTMRDAISDAIGTDDPLITGLIDLLIQQLVIKPLTDALAGAANGGGFGSILATFASSFFGGGRASGGHVVGGRMYRINEGAGGRMEGFVPAQSGQIIPLGRMRGQAGGGVRLFQTVNVDARGVNPEGFADHIRASVRQETVAIVREGMGQVRRQVPGRMAEYQRDGR